MFRHGLCVLACVFLCPAMVQGQITLSQDFDSGSLDVVASRIDGDTIELVGRATWTKRSEYRWIYFSADDVLGRSLEFSIDANQFLGSYENHRYVYSYDQENWEFFDNARIDDGQYRFSNESPFVGERVYVAYGLPYPVERMTAYVQDLKSNPYVSPTASADSEFVVAQSAIGIDDSGREVPVQNVYGFKITDSNAGPKRKVLLEGGSHSAGNGRQLRPGGDD